MVKEIALAGDVWFQMLNCLWVSFFLLYTNEIREIVSLEEGNAAIPKGLRAAMEAMP